MEVNVMSPPTPSWRSDQMALRRAHLLREIDRDGTTRRRIRAPSVRLGAAIAVAALVVVATALAVGLDLVGRQDAVHQQNVTSNPIGPKPASGSVVIASGDSGWQLLAWKSDKGICLDIADSASYASDCGFPVTGDSGADLSGAGPHEIARFISPRGATTVISGVAAADVARVEAVQSDGSVSSTTLVPAPSSLETPLQFFYATSSSETNPIVTLNGYAADGTLLQTIPAGL